MAVMKTSDDDRLWVQVIRLHAQVEGELARELQTRHGLGLSEYRSLCHLASAEGGEKRIQDLAQLVGLNESSVSRLVMRLEQAGLVVRDHCPDDRRGIYAVLTDEGRQRYNTARPTYEKTLTVALDRAADGPLGPLVQTLRQR